MSTLLRSLSQRLKTVQVALALAFGMAVGVASAQSQGGSGQPPSRDADKTQADEADKSVQGKAAQPPAKTKPKDDSRKPKRDKAADDKDSGRELEEEEDI